MEEKINSFHAKTRTSWRSWLKKNHQIKESVWLIIYKKQSKIPSIYYPEAVEEALCFGWIDSLANKRDEISYYQFFSKRKPKSNWSKVNKQRVADLIEKGLMTAEGLKMVDLAKQSGTWIKLNEVDDIVLPEDLKKMFNKNKLAFRNWNRFAKSSQRVILGWILNAKRDETRQKRLKETVELAERNIKAHHPKQ